MNRSPFLGGIRYASKVHTQVQKTVFTLSTLDEPNSDIKQISFMVFVAVMQPVQIKIPKGPKYCQIWLDVNNK